MHTISASDLDRLKAWFQEKKRDLPWRNSPTPYAVWISEVMLQQTQVSVVVPYFQRWMLRFPTIQSLAKAPQEEVLKLWEGLGYYSRARQLLEGAKTICSRFNGDLPETEEGLRQIKGLGPYTIGAIRSFAFRKKATAIDGNVLRVITRYCEIKESVSKAKTIETVRKCVAASLPEEEHWLINEALIELGATVCKKKPLCTFCPLRSECQGRKNGVAELLPFKPKPPKTISLERIACIISSRGKILIKQNKDSKVMRDLCEFPYLEKESAIQKNFEASIFDQWSLNATHVESLGSTSHTFTKYRVKLQGEIFTADSCSPVSGYEWIPSENLEGLPFSSGHKRLLNQWILRAGACRHKALQ